MIGILLSRYTHTQCVEFRQPTEVRDALELVVVEDERLELAQARDSLDVREAVVAGVEHGELRHPA